MSKLTKEQAIILSAFTGVLCCEFADMHEAVEKRLGHPVWTHRFGDKDFAGKVKELFREDFLAILPHEEKKRGGVMSTYWGYRCNDCMEASEKTLNHGDSQLRNAWEVRDEIYKILNCGDYIIDVRIVGAYGDELNFLMRHKDHSGLCLRNEYGEELPLATKLKEIYELP